LQGWLVRQGLALSFTKYSRAYEADERAAQAAKAGMWACSFIAQCDWRFASPKTEILGALAVLVTAQAQLLKSAANNAPASSEGTIKGNISRSGERIYHVAGGRSYEATVIDLGAGEQWFCTPAEAEAAGWLRAKS